MKTRWLHSLILPVLLLAGCRAQSSSRMSPMDVADRMAAAEPATQALRLDDLLGSWMVHDYRANAGEMAVDAVLEFNPDGTYTLRSAMDHVRLGSGMFRLVHGHLILESEGCSWPPANRLHHCIGVYTVRAVRRGDITIQLVFDLVRDKDHPERATNLHAASLFRIVHW